MWDKYKTVLTHSQMKMLEKVLGKDYYIGNDNIRDILSEVLECGYYRERDRKVLNLTRDCYLGGKNWIK